MRTKIKDIKTAEEAREVAIEWQRKMSGENMSYGELTDWQEYFEELAKKFDLEEEFQENGII